MNPTQVVDVFERLVRIETKLDQNLDVQKDHETRIRRVESSRLKALGILSLVTFLGWGFWKTLFATILKGKSVE